MLRRPPFYQMQRTGIEKRGGRAEICLRRYVAGEIVEFMRGRQAGDGGCVWLWRVAMCGWQGSEYGDEGRVQPNTAGIRAGRPRWSTGATFILSST